MQNFQIIDYSILGFGGLFCIIWAFSLFLLTPFKVNIAAVFFVGTSGFRLIWEAFTLSGIVFDNPDIYAYPIPFLYLIGPSILLYYERLGGKEEWNLNLYHFIPCILAFIPIVNWIKLDAKIELINFILNSKFNFPEFLFVLWVIGPKISILIYSMVITLGKSGEGVRAIRSLPEEIKLFSIILLTYIWIMIVTDILGYLLGIPILYRASAWSHSIAALIVYLYSKIHPSAILDISTAIKSTRYSRSKLTGIDTRTILLKLNNLMEHELYFADEDLRLSTLADAVKVTPHQLSELINVNFNMSFITFINSHRIHSACDMLIKENRNILSIGFAVGFNSKSAFNRVFKQLIGTSPGNFRKNRTKYNEAILKLKEKLRPNL